MERPLDVTENEDDSAELHCFANGNPRPLIRWFMNGTPLHGNFLFGFNFKEEIGFWKEKQGKMNVFAVRLFLSVCFKSVC